MQYPPRRTHSTGLILTGGLLLALVGTLVLTFAVAISASTGDKGVAATVAPTLTTAPTATQTAPTATPTAPPKPTVIPSPNVGISAQSAFALDVETGAALVALRADERRPMASLTKMVSALVVAGAIRDRHVSLADEVVIDESDVVDPDVFSHMGLVAGDTVTVEQLLDGMLIPSGNDAARALARFVGLRLPGEEKDPMAAFIAAMNATVADLGLHDTHFGNPDGDDDASNYSTAHDLAYIGAEVMATPLLARIVSVPQVTVTSVGPERRDYELFNTNRLLGEAGVDGVKTGTTDGAGACLVASSVLANGHRVVVVVMGSAPDPGDFDSDPDGWPRFADALAILGQISGA